MPRWLEILLTLVLFAAGMAVVSWAVNATVPAGIEWLWHRIGGVAVWAGLITTWIICAFFGWRGHRKAGRAAGR